ncbi:MAG: ATP synthase F0 subunit C [Bryobacter sp.]|nr:ATP synthase F0 subunit C [Bryobacter sp.]
MRSKTLLILFLLSFTVPSFAQGTTSGSTNGLLLPAFAMAIAAGLCGLAQGNAIKGAVEGIARNPGASGKITTALLIGLALIESLALLTFLKVG